VGSRGQPTPPDPERGARRSGQAGADSADIARATALSWSLDALDDHQVEKVRAVLSNRILHQCWADGLHLAATAVLAVGIRPV
jgi:hypothetical protein